MEQQWSRLAFCGNVYGANMPCGACSTCKFSVPVGAIAKEGYQSSQELLNPEMLSVRRAAHSNSILLEFLDLLMNLATDSICWLLGKELKPSMGFHPGIGTSWDSIR
jgi:hypothetical protein